MQSGVKHLFLFLLSAALPFLLYPADRVTDSLKKILPGLRNDSQRVETLASLAWKLRTNDRANAAAYAMEALRLSEKINYAKGISDAYRTMGSVNYNIGNYSAALENYFKALKVSDRANDKSSGSKILGSIGIVYQMQKDYDKALDCYVRSMQKFKELGDTYNVGIALGNIGIIYKAQHNLPKALDYYFRSQKIYIDLDRKSDISSGYLNIGNIYYEKNDFPLALEYYSKALKIDEEIPDEYSVAFDLGSMGEAYRRQKKFSQAREYLNQSLSISKKMGIKIECSEIYASLSLLDSAERNDRAAFENYKMYVLYTDSLNNEENTKKTVQVQMRYDFERKQAADSVKNAERMAQENLKHAQEIRQQKLYAWGGAAGFLLMLAIAWISFRAYRQKQKDNVEIVMQKNMIEEKQKEIVASIQYAKRIQGAILPTRKYIDKTLKRLK